MQKHVSQQAKTHQLRSIASLKIVINRATKADSKVVRLAKNELQRKNLKDFDYDVSKTVEKVRYLVATIEVNAISSVNHTDDEIAVFEHNAWCEDFRLHLKMFEMKKIQGNEVDLELMLIELETKHTNIINKNEWSSSRSKSTMY